MKALARVSPRRAWSRLSMQVWGRVWSWLGIWLGVLALCGPAAAQDPAAMAAMRGNAQFHAAAEKIFLEYESSLSGKCTEIHPDWTRATHLVYGQTQLDTQGNMLRATWAETVPGTACGQPRRFRTIVFIRDGKAAVLRMLPGESNASPTLEKDVRSAVMGAVKVHTPALAAGCSLDVLDTNIVGHTVPRAGAPWDEVWLVSVCGRRMNVPIGFVPDGAGGGATYRIDPRRISDAT